LRCLYIQTGRRCKFGIQTDSYGFFQGDPKMKKKCFACKNAAIELYCPIYNWDKEIPYEFLSMKNLPIATLGVNASGASTYIGVLINEIKNKMSGPFNCSLSMDFSKKSKDTYDNCYYKPLYVDERTLDATCITSDGIPPLIFPLTFLSGKNRIVDIAALTFYDTPGENLQDKTVMYKYNRYIMNAYGIILLLDPLQVPSIQKQLTDRGFTGWLPYQDIKIDNVLDNIINMIRNEKKIPLKDQIKIPLALVVTKIDVLEQYNILPPDSCLREESEHLERGAFVTSDFENTNIEIQNLIYKWLDGQLMIKIKQFEHHSFFGVSSLGGNPNGQNIDSKGIRPRRVLDPFLWLLAENKYIKTLGTGEIEICNTDGSTTTFIERCMKSYGLAANINGTEIVRNIIFKDTVKPAHEERVFETSRANQASINLRVYENNSLEEDATVEESTQMYESCEVKLTPGLPENAPINIIFDLDNNGILIITAVDLTNNIPLTVSPVRIGGEAANVDMEPIKRTRLT